MHKLAMNKCKLDMRRNYPTNRSPGTGLCKVLMERD